MNLKQICDRIDQLDRQIAALLTERMEITNEVAAYKIEHSLPVYHPEREKQVIEKVSALIRASWMRARKIRSTISQAKSNFLKICRILF